MHRYRDASCSSVTVGRTESWDIPGAAAKDDRQSPRGAGAKPGVAFEPAGRAERTLLIAFSPCIVSQSSLSVRTYHTPPIGTTATAIRRAAFPSHVASLLTSMRSSSVARWAAASLQRRSSSAALPYPRALPSRSLVAPRVRHNATLSMQKDKDYTAEMLSHGKGKVAASGEH